MNYARVYKLGNWVISVPENLISKGELGFYIQLDDKIGPFEVEQELAVWLVQNRSRTVNHGVMTEFTAPPDYTYVCTEDQEDVCKLTEAFINHGISFRYIPPDIEDVLIYMLMIKKSDLNAAKHAFEMTFGEPQEGDGT